MIEAFSQLPVVLQAFIATVFTWLMTLLGSSFVFFNVKPNRKFLDISLGFAAGIMIAASFWSLLLPALEMAEQSSLPQWIPVTVGFLLGAGFLRLLDKFVPHLHLNTPEEKAEGVEVKKLKKPMLLILAITLHNLPEGLAVGVAFGSLQYGGLDMTTAGAVALAIGIGIQNIPEGTAVALPLRAEGLSRWKSFNYGQLSGLMEPIGGLIGVLTVSFSQAVLPYALSFAAGAMIFVVIEEVIPESQSGESTDWATFGAIMGFTLMMILDTAL